MKTVTHTHTHTHTHTSIYNLAVVRISVLSLMLLALNLELRAQEPVVFEEWASTKGVQEYFYKNVTKTDGSQNVYVAGATLNENGDYDLLITKFDRRGNLLWTDTIAGPAGGHDFATDLDFDHSGNVVVSGSIAAGGGENNNMLAVKYSDDGTELWRLSHDYNNNNEGAASLVIDQANNIYLTGATQQETGYTDVITLKIDSTSALQWEELYDGNNLHDAGVRIEISGSRVIVTGGSQLNSLSWKVMAMSYLQVDGTLTGYTASSGTDPGVEEVTDLVIDDNDNIYIAGSTINVSTGYDMLLIKLDEDLNIEWTKEWDGEGMTDKGSGLRVAPNGDVYLCGTTETTTGDDIALLKFNSEGNSIWAEQYDSDEGGDDAATAMEWQAGGFLYITGNTHKVSNLDYLTMKYDSTGSLIWEITYNSPYNNDDKATNMAIDDEGGIVVSGQCEKNDSVMTYYTVKYVGLLIDKPKIEFAESEMVSFEKNAWQLRYPDSLAATEVKFFTDVTIVPQYFQDDRISFITNNYAGDTLLADTLDRFDMILDKGGSDTKVMAYDKTDFFKNYYLGGGVQPVLRNYHYRSLYYESPWQGIDFHVQKDSLGIVNYTLSCSPQSDLSSINFDFSGHQSLAIDSLGQLYVATTVDTVVFTAPSGYTVDSFGASQPLSWTPSWDITGMNSLSLDGSTDSTSFFIEFSIVSTQSSSDCTPDYQQNNCVWSTHYGVGAGEQVRGMDVTSGQEYLLVKKTAMDVPPLTFVQGVNPDQIDINPDPSVFLYNYGYVEIVGFNAVDDIEWITVYGGSGELRPEDIKYYDEHIYVTGYTIFGGAQTTIADDIYITENADQPEFGGGTSEGFVLRCNEAGEIDWSTFLGRNGHEQLSVLEIDEPNNRLIVAGLHGSASAGGSNLEPISLNGAYNNQVYEGSQGLLVRYKLDDFQKDWLTFLGNQEGELGIYGGGVTIHDMVVIGSKLFICGDLYNVRFGVSELPVPITSSFQFPFGAPTGAHLETTTGEGVGTGFITEFDMQNYSITWSTALAGSDPENEFGISESALAITGREDAFGRITLAVAMYSKDESLSLMSQLTPSGFSVHTNPNSVVVDDDATTAIIKFHNKNVNWATYFGTYNEDYPTDVYMDMDNNIFLSGLTFAASSVEQNEYCSENSPGGYPLCSSDDLFFIDPTFNYTSLGSPQIDGYISAFNTSNNLIWSTFFSGATAGAGPPDDFVSNMSQNPVTLELYCAGTTQGGCFPIFEQPLAFNQPEHGLGHFDAFTSKFDISQIYLVTSFEDDDNESGLPSVELFPNPGIDILQLTMEYAPSEVMIEAYDIRGVQITQEKNVNLNNGLHAINVSKWPSGMYLIKIAGTDWSVTKKWIKQ